MTAPAPQPQDRPGGLLRRVGGAMGGPTGKWPWSGHMPSVAAAKLPTIATI